MEPYKILTRMDGPQYVFDSWEDVLANPDWVYVKTYHAHEGDKYIVEHGSTINKRGPARLAAYFRIGRPGE